MTKPHDPSHHEKTRKHQVTPAEPEPVIAAPAKPVSIGDSGPSVETATSPDLEIHEAVIVAKDSGPVVSKPSVVVVSGLRSFIADNWKILGAVAFAILSAAQSKYHFLNPDDWTQIVNYGVAAGILTGHQFGTKKPVG